MARPTDALTGDQAQQGVCFYASLEQVEKQFDRAFVDLDLLLGQVDIEQLELTLHGRRKLTILSAAFARLIHKCQSLFHANQSYQITLVSSIGSLVIDGNSDSAIYDNSLAAIRLLSFDLFTTRQASGLAAFVLQPANCFLQHRQALSSLGRGFVVEFCGYLSFTQVELNTVKQDLIEAEASKRTMENELRWMTMQFHVLQCQQLSKNGTQETDIIKKKLDEEIDSLRREISTPARLAATVMSLKNENENLRKYISALQNEVYGARLAAKYLDKELAGRIQQIQLMSHELLGSEHDRLWEQIEAEIHLHRHKTVIRACQGRQNFNALSHAASKVNKNETDRTANRSGKLRTVLLKRNADEGLGLSITGGREHGVPILISDIHENQVADRVGLLKVGDAILSVNGIDLIKAKHAEAVKILSEQKGTLELVLLYLSPDRDSDDEESKLTICSEDGTTFKMYEKCYPSNIKKTSTQLYITLLPTKGVKAA
ncbi:Golgi-associated PDZ and coiled-coil motif-containing protein [Trichinella murrelli]|uniref:Golgi-associated PDZ and coiled-coil motif-containing protein n=1 Tax=Trichinella murrelli TaxID=144512 RepID=A0A0V0U6F9_9BILA|nr:Golgi-associated PDZ and coiled-coil motif-containing protein [Trichinella murrelli]